MRVGDRDRRPELMDRPDADARELARSLADLRAANRWLGGTRTVLRLLDPLAGSVADRPLRILDVATGSADVPVAVSRWAARRGWDVSVIAADIHVETLREAREHARDRAAVRLVAGDAVRLPFGDGAFHLALCSTALHHFSDADAVGVLRELARVSSSGVVVLDLRRSAAALAAVQLLASTVWRRHPITRHDAPASVRGAFTPRELRQLASRAGMEGAKVTSQPLFRHSLVYRHPAPEPGPERGGPARR